MTSPFSAHLGNADLAVVGGGILGLATAWTAARAGWRVAVIERSPRAMGASIRNFGMVWPVGQAPRVVLPRALRSRELWLQMLAETGLWHDPCGSLHAAFQEDEAEVLREFARLGPDHGYTGEFLDPTEVIARFPAIRRQGLTGAFHSPTEICVDPRRIVWDLPPFLAEQHGVAFHFGTTALHAEPGTVYTSRGRLEARRILVASGSDFEILFPDLFARAGLVRCKLQMMRTVPQPGGWRIGTMLAFGLTLLHYACFEICPTLDAVRERLDRELPAYRRHGIHVMASQNGANEVVIGDHHEYGDDITPYDRPEFDDLILDYLRARVDLPTWEIAERWHGVYNTLPGATEFLAAPDPTIRVASFTSGNGMTTSFGLAEEIWNRWDDHESLLEIAP